MSGKATPIDEPEHRQPARRRARGARIAALKRATHRRAGRGAPTRARRQDDRERHGRRGARGATRATTRPTTPSAMSSDLARRPSGRPRCRPAPCAPSVIATTVHDDVDEPVARRAPRGRLGARACRPAAAAAASAAARRAASPSRLIMTAQAYGRRRARDPLPKSIADIDRAALPAAVARPWRILLAMIESQGLTKRLGGRTVVARRVVSLRARDRHRVPRAQRRRQDDDAADARRACPSPTPAEGRSSAARYRDLPNPGRRVGVLLDAGAQHGGRRGREALAVSAQIMGVDERARRRAARARRPRPLGRPQARAPVLAGHAPAPGHRPRAARRSRGR